MEEVRKLMREALATVFAFYYKVHSFHWNVEGQDFYEYHHLFEDIYSDVYDSIDPLAEEIRALSATAPLSLAEIKTLTKISETTGPLNTVQMVNSLFTDNAIVIDSLNAAFASAQKQNLQGLCNFLADRLDKHNKWAWFLRSSKKGN